MSDEIDKLKAELKAARRQSQLLQSENTRLKAMLGAFSVKPAAALDSPRPRPRPRAVPSGDENSGQAGNSLNPTSNDRIRLFRELFHGRQDVYAVRWENRKGASGYSPACANEWDPLLCKKPCSKCPNSQYIPVSDDAIRAHLLGEKTIGVYPLLKDETCWFLAADFDKASWEDDVKAFLETCRTMDVPAYLERSRSGKGGHVWIFFEDALPASLSRQLGSAILTRTMEVRHQVGLDSYDRLFPNQDTMPKGGFGNLIALPLQRRPRERGNTIFLDETLTPYPEQWQVLGSFERVSSQHVQRLVDTASHRGVVIGARMALTDENGGQDPWTLPPSRRRSEKPLQGPLPRELHVVRANQLFIDKQDLGPALVNRLLRLAAFQNPAFYAAQSMRLSTVGKPRIIACAEEFPRHLALPRGCLEELCAFVECHGVTLRLEDRRFEGRPVAVGFHGRLTEEQEVIATRVVENDEGVLVAPTGFGKTVLAAWLIAQRKTNTLVLVHRTTLLDQWREQLSLFLGLDTGEIGVIGGGRRQPNNTIDVGMLQSLQKKGEVSDLVAEYGQIIVDECHHVSAFTFERVMREVKAKYVLGLTATPIRKDGHHPIIFMQCGPIRERVSSTHAAAQRPFRHVVVFRQTDFNLELGAEESTIQDVYAALVRDEERNALIIEDVWEALREGRSPLVLTERIAHLERLESLLHGKVKHILVFRGGMGRRQRTATLEQARELSPKEPRVILATGRYIGEGFDDARLDSLFLAMPISWRGTLQQYAGRLHRLHEGKKEVRVYDYVDGNAPVLMRMFARRVRGYQAMGYATDGQIELV